MIVVFAAAGTAGHIKPALVVARRLTAGHRAEVSFIGTGQGLEKRLVPHSGYPLYQVAAAGWRRGRVLGNIHTLVSLLWGCGQAYWLLRRLRPSVVVGMGSFISIPVVAAARLLRIPILLHEQNALPGLANRRLAPWADAVAVPYSGMEHYFPRARNLEHTGIPVEPELISLTREEARDQLGISGKAFLLLAFGGSRGAGPINETVFQAAPGLLQEPDLHLVWIAGEAYREEYRRRMLRDHPGLADNPRLGLEGYRMDISALMAAADLVVCRAGATTLAELTARGLPAILVPSGYVVDDHQRFNASRLAEGGGGVMLSEDELKPGRLIEEVLNLKSDEAILRNMGRRSRGLGVLEAGERMEQLILDLAGE